MQRYSIEAFNTATASANKIHDDAVAAALGFRGGLVPGVDVYAYLTQAPVREWGRAWLERGTISARFHQPVYDGDLVEVAPDPEGGAGALVLSDSAGGVCARATVAMPATAACCRR